MTQLYERGHVRYRSSLQVHHQRLRGVEIVRAAVTLNASAEQGSITNGDKCRVISRGEVKHLLDTGAVSDVERADILEDHGAFFHLVGCNGGKTLKLKGPLDFFVEVGSSRRRLKLGRFFVDVWALELGNTVDEDLLRCGTYLQWMAIPDHDVGIMSCMDISERT